MPLPARVLSAGTAGLCAGLSLYVLVWVAGSWLEHLSVVDRTEPRIGRLLGYISEESAITRAEREVERRLELLAYPADVDSNQVGAQLQQALRGFAEDAGLNVSGSQLLKRSDKEAFPGFNVLFVELSMMGTPAAIDSFLGLVDTSSPALKIDELVLSEQGRRRAATRRGQPTADSDEVIMQVTISALQVAQP